MATRSKPQKPSDDWLSVLLIGGRYEVRASCSYSIRLLEHLASEQIRAEMICSDASRIQPEKLTRLPIREYRNFDRPLWGRVVLEGIRRDFAAAPPDLIHVQSPAVYPAALWLARQWKRTCVLSVAGTLNNRLRLAGMGTVCRRIIAISRSVRNDLIRINRIPAGLVNVVHGGVELPAEPPSLILGGGRRPVVGTAGPLEASKGLPFFLGAAARVRRQREGVEYLLCGSGPEEHNLRRLAKNLELPDVLTFVPNLLDFGTSLDAMDIFCLTSLQQGLGTTMLEAMARGRPVIATLVGGVESIITNEKNGLIIKSSDSQQLADRIVELLEDPELARKLGQAGQRLVREQFQVKQMVHRTAEIYREVTHRPALLPA